VAVGGISRIKSKRILKKIMAYKSRRKRKLGSSLTQYNRTVTGHTVQYLTTINVCFQQYVLRLSADQSHSSALHSVAALIHPLTKKQDHRLGGAVPDAWKETCTAGGMLL
jgi:hypothetical protein